MSNREVWEVETTLKIAIHSETEVNELAQSHNPKLLKVTLNPIILENNDSNEFSLKIQFAHITDNEKSVAQSVTNLGNRLLDETISRLSYLSNSPVIKNKPPSFTYKYPETNKFRKLLLPDQKADIQPPTKIDDFKFMTENLNPKITNALLFLHEAIKTVDLLGSFINLWAALEILVNLYEIEDFEPKGCSNCGFIYQNNPGVADRIRYVLTNYLSQSPEEIESIWKIRNEISHGGLELSDYKFYDVENKRNKLYVIVKKLINLKIDNETDNSNENIPFSLFTGAILDIDYILPSE